MEQTIVAAQSKLLVRENILVELIKFINVYTNIFLISDNIIFFITCCNIKSKGKILIKRKINKVFKNDATCKRYIFGYLNTTST